MTNEKPVERDDYREFLSYPQIGLLEYLTESDTQRRVGNFLAVASARAYFAKIHDPAFAAPQT